MFKKILITASALLAILTSGVAMAGSWDPSSDGSAPAFATELSAAGTDILTPDTALYTMSTVTPAASAAYLVDWTLTGATWGATLTTAAMTFVPKVATPGGDSNVLLVAGGTVGTSTAQFRVDVVSVQSAGDALRLTYTITGTTGLAAATGTVKLAVALSDNVGAVDTPGAASTIASALAGVTVTGATGGATEQINVSTSSLAFNALGTDKNVVIGTVAFAATAARVSDNSAAWDLGSAGDDDVTDGVITITGDFAAAVNTNADVLTDPTNLTKDGVVVSGCKAGNATTLNATTATFAFTAAEADALPGTTCTFTMNVDGVTAIGASTFTLLTTMDYTLATVTDMSVASTGYALTKDGATKVLNLALTPGGAFSNYVRVDNTSAVAGKVIVTMYNDAGSSVTYDLSTVAGQTGTLAAQASSSLITIQALYDAAVAADATFAHNDGKLRLSLDGEFTTMTAQSITLSTDNTTFSTF